MGANGQLRVAVADPATPEGAPVVVGHGEKVHLTFFPGQVPGIPSIFAWASARRRSLVVILHLPELDIRSAVAPATPPDGAPVIMGDLGYP